MKSIAISFLFLSFALGGAGEKNRVMTYNGKEVSTTFGVDQKFIGTYEGNKGSGFLTLKDDGTGIYRYDVFGFAPEDCQKEEIVLEWGFLINDGDSTLRFERDYGYSYPILLKSTGTTKFKGCREETMLDFILEYKDGSLGVSSSDDWKKGNL